jgi:hypothetical protein
VAECGQLHRKPPIETEAADLSCGRLATTTARASAVVAGAGFYSMRRADRLVPPTLDSMRGEDV